MSKDVLDMVLASLPVIDLSNHWSRTNIQALLAPGKWIALQSAFYFKAMHKNHGGRNQRTRALRRRSGIEITFEFDAWDSTSSSSQNRHLRGHQTAVSVLQARNIEHKERGVHISCSCLAIGSGFAEGRVELGDRPPPSHWQQRQVFEEDDAELDTFD
jgi:hypothetical protein